MPIAVIKQIAINIETSLFILCIVIPSFFVRLCKILKCNEKGKRILCNSHCINYPFATNKQVLSYLRPPYSIAYRPICIAPHRFYSTYIIPHFGRFFNTSGLISLICTIIQETFLTIRHTRVFNN